MEIGQRLKAFRNQKNITQNEVAESSGIHPVTIRKYETSVMEPKLVHIKKIASALNISIPSLLGSQELELKSTSVGDIYSLIFFMVESGFLDFKLMDSKIILSLNKCLTSFFADLNVDRQIETQLSNLEGSNDLKQWIEYQNTIKEKNFSELSEEQRKEILEKKEMLEIKLMSL